MAELYWRDVKEHSSAPSPIVRRCRLSGAVVPQRQLARLKTSCIGVRGLCPRGQHARTALAGHLSSENTCRTHRAKGEDLSSPEGERLGEYLGQAGTELRSGPRAVI